MKKSGIRTHRVAELIKAEVGRLLIGEFQDPGTGLLTVTRVELTADLQTARIFISSFGGDKEGVLDRLNRGKGVVRKILASRVNLKYNPQLIFALDPGADHEERIGRLIESTKSRGT